MNLLSKAGNCTGGNTLLERIDAYVQTIRERRPLTTDEVKELDTYFRIGMAYVFNALEGNSLTLSEIKVLLEDDTTVGGKPIWDCYEAAGYTRTYDYMLEIAGGGPPQFQEGDMLHLHALFYDGIDPRHAGRYREGQVFITGMEYVPPTAEGVPSLVAELAEELNRRRDATHPVLLTVYVHRRLVDIHPFQDGNGRTAQLLMNLILVNRGCYVASIPPILCHNYITALQQAQRTRGPSDTAFIRLTCECELKAQRDYCRIFRIKSPKQRKGALE